MKEILVNTEMQEKRAAIVKDGILDEYYIERPSYKTIVGNIYKGRIDSIVPSIGAAFVEIGLERKAFFIFRISLSRLSPSLRLRPKKRI